MKFEDPLYSTQTLEVGPLTDPSLKPFVNSESLTSAQIQTYEAAIATIGAELKKLHEAGLTYCNLMHDGKSKSDTIKMSVASYRSKDQDKVRLAFVFGSPSSNERHLIDYEVIRDLLPTMMKTVLEVENYKSAGLKYL